MWRVEEREGEGGGREGGRKSERDGGFGGVTQKEQNLKVEC